MQGRVVNLEQAKLLIKVQTHNNNSNEEEGGGIRQLQDSLIGKTSSALFPRCSILASFLLFILQGPPTLDVFFNLDISGT